MPTEVACAEQTWRVLWFHAAHQIISVIPLHDTYETVSVGYGWGVRNPHNGRALLIHPTGDGREIGDLSLTVRGVGTQIIPRSNSDYMAYLHTVTDVVETVTRSHLKD